MKGLHNLLAEAILISILVASLSIINAWQASLQQRINNNNEDNPSVELLSCGEGKALMLAISNGKLSVKTGEILSLKIYREVNGEIKVIENTTLLSKGDIIELGLPNSSGYLLIGEKILYYNNDENRRICVLS